MPDNWSLKDSTVSTLKVSEICIVNKPTGDNPDQN